LGTRRSDTLDLALELVAIDGDVAVAPRPDLDGACMLRDASALHDYGSLRAAL
jgi:hypothetical protein